MSSGLILTLLVAAGTLAFVIVPLLRKDAGAIEQNSAVLSRSRELQSKRDMLVAALKDLEDDRATDKLDDADYQGLKRRLSEQAMEVMRQMDEHEANPHEPGTAPFPRIAANPPAGGE